MDYIHTSSTQSILLKLLTFQAFENLLFSFLSLPFLSPARPTDRSTHRTTRLTPPDTSRQTAHVSMSLKTFKSSFTTCLNTSTENLASKTGCTGFATWCINTFLCEWGSFLPHQPVTPYMENSYSHVRLHMFQQKCNLLLFSERRNPHPSIHVRSHSLLSHIPNMIYHVVMDLCAASIMPLSVIWCVI